MVAIVGLTVSAGCFAEPVVPGSGGSTGDPQCVAGTLGCECGPGSACDDALACEPSVSLCIDPACTPGEQLCTCDDGRCLGDLACEGGLCRQPSAADTTQGSPATTSPDDDGGPGTVSIGDGATTTVASSTGMDPTADTGAATGDPTGEPSMCAEMACVDCFNCTTSTGAQCERADKACDENPDCMALRACAKDCLGDLSCIETTCCNNLMWTDGLQDFNGLVDCVAKDCSCLANLSCSGG